MDDFFKYEGVKIAAYFAHPLSTFEGGRYSVYSDRVEVEITYAEGTSHITIFRSGDYFSNIRVTHDTFFWSPFSVSQGMKDLAVLYLEEDAQSQGVTRKYESYLNKSILEMSGIEMALIALTIAWLNY
jgi:hypothetical protein